MFYSHKNILLIEHLQTVGTQAYIKASNLSISQKYPWLPDIARIIGYTHDFGKYTSFFQQYLKDQAKHDTKSQHSLISSLFCAFQIENYIASNKGLKSFLSIYNDNVTNIANNLSPNIITFLPLICYIVVNRHHGNLKSLEKIIPKINFSSNKLETKSLEQEIRNQLPVLETQINDISKNVHDIKSQVDQLNLLGCLQEFLNVNVIKKLILNLNYLKYQIEEATLPEHLKLELYFTTLLLFSILIDSDKKSANRHIPVTVTRRSINSDIVDIYCNKKFSKLSSISSDHQNYSKSSLSSIINSIRNEIYAKVIDKVTNIDLRQKLFTLTAPTGSGKTLTALSLALKLRKRIENTQRIKPRIIYALPFVNIIEQNYNIFHNVLKQIDDYTKNSSCYLIKHHYSSPIKYRDADEYKSVDEASLLIESWESEIIVTTFVQLLQSVIGYENSFLKKIYNIVDSIIILDEIQCVPVEYWQLIGNALKALSDYYNCWIILMTATKPLIFTSNLAYELLDNNKDYFDKLNRVTLKPIFYNPKTSSETQFNVDQFIDWFLRNYNPSKSYLIVLNTISISKEIYNKLKDTLNFNGFCEYEKIYDKCSNELCKRKLLEKKSLLKKIKKENHIFYLSTNLVPMQRLYRIKMLKKLLEKNIKPILVSTQVVEAGVDLDFDVVIRDIGPLDSIIQCAGRCNRNNNKKSKGEVYIISLEDGMAEKVYGKIHPHITKKLLVEGNIPESKFFELINSYFEEVTERVSIDKSNDIYNAMLNLNFYNDLTPSSVASFKLIVDKGIFYDLFVELDKQSQRIKKFFINNVVNEKDFVKRKENFLKIKKEFFDYVIHVRKEKLDKNMPVKLDKTNYYYVPYNQVDIYYDLETGFKNDESYSIFL